MRDDTRAAFRAFNVDPSWYREYWFAEAGPASPRPSLGEARPRPSGLARVPRLVASALAAVAAVLGRGPCRPAITRY
jgi:hypothetical protein